MARKFMDVTENPADSSAPVQAVAPSLARGAFNLRLFAGDAGLIIGGALVANIFNYFYHFALSRRLGPNDYGSLVTLIAISSIVGVVASAISVVAMQECARMWASLRDERIPTFVRRVGPAAAGIGAATGAGILLASIPLAPYVHIVQASLWLIFAAYITIGIYVGFVRGAAQGAHRFALFSVSLVGDALIKLALGIALVAAGLRVSGAVAALALGSVAGIAIVLPPMIAGGRSASHERAHLELGGEAVRVLYVTVASTALLFIDIIFAKHHLSGVAAGYYAAAGTIARTIPFAAGFVGMVLMPKAAAARHASRESLGRLLALTVGLTAAIAVVGMSLMFVFPEPLLRIAFGPAFVNAAPLLRIYGVNAALFALYGTGVNYLVATREYGVGVYLVAAVVVEAAIMAAFGDTPVRLLMTAIAVNAALIPIFAWFLVRSVRRAPQAGAP